MAEKTADKIVGQPTGEQIDQCGNGSGLSGPVKHSLINQPNIGVPQVDDADQRETRQPGAVGLPIKPMQGTGRKYFWANKVLLWVVKTATMNGPQFTVDAALFQIVILWQL